MQKNEIIFYRVLYIFISFILAFIMILHAESRQRAVALPVVFHAYADPASYHYDYQDFGPLNELSSLRYIYSKIVYIDPGHGGHDPGAVRAGIYEKDITLIVALMVYDLINQGDSGIRPILSRYSDIHVNNRLRAEQASQHADILVSIHCNDFTMSSVYGVEVHFDSLQTLSPYLRFDLTSRDLAQILQRTVIAATGARDRGTRDTTEHQTAFVVTSTSTIPSVIVEMGYMSNPAELALLVSEGYQRMMARGIYNGIREAFGLEPR